LIHYFDRAPSDYAFLLLDVEMPEIIRRIQSEIPEEDLYTEEGPDKYGLEKESHITIYPCMDNDTDPEMIKPILIPLSDVEIRIMNISIFDGSTKNYIVLKADIESLELDEMNNAMKNIAVSHSEFKEYHPHITIAYIKKNSDTYKQFLQGGLDIEVNPIKYTFSYNNNGELKKLKL